MNGLRDFSLSGKPFAALSACVALSGCIHFVPKPLTPAQTGAALESRTLSDAGLRDFMERNLGHALDEWPLKRWDQDLLTLAAFYYNPALQTARAHWSVAQAGVSTARARPNPILSVTPNYATNPPSGVSPWLPSAALDLTIETAGKRRYRIDQASQLSESARWNIVTTAWEVRLNLRASLLDFAAAQKREALLEDQLALQEHIVRLFEKRVTAGAVAGSEMILSRTQLAKTRLDLQAARSQLTDARARVANALGVPLSALDGPELAFDFDTTDAAELTSDEVRRQALQGRSDVLSDLADYAAAQSALQLAIAKQYPDVRLGPGYQWDQGQHDWSLGFALELPVFDRHRGPIAEAEARRSEVTAVFMALQAKVINEVDHAASAFRSAQEASQAAESLLSVQRQQLQAMQAQLNAGAVDALEVSTARFELTAAEALAFEARVRQQQALGELESAVQRPLGTPERANAQLRQIESAQGPP
jgi:cobalt-zinc-cadmium efflux system outer membrane protein